MKVLIGMKEEWEVVKFMNILNERKAYLKQKYKVKKIGVFGSFLRNRQNKNSDLDILVEFFEHPSLFKFVELENYLSEILGVKVDLVMEDALKPNIGKRILSEAVYI